MFLPVSINSQMFITVRQAYTNPVKLILVRKVSASQYTPLKNL